MAEDRIEVTRRDVLLGAGAAALAGSLAAAAEKGGSQGGVVRAGPGPVKIAMRVNGDPVSVDVEPRVTLLDALRDHLGLTGTKRICDHGACGGCTVLLDGKPVNACMLLALDAAGRKVTTIEGLSKNGQLHPVQKAFIKHDALQCGFCTPGMVIACVALLDSNPHPSEEEIREAVAGNLCRCGTYPHVFAAVKEVAG